MARKIAFLPSRSAHSLRRFGERLRLLRVRHRLSAKQMAAAAGMSVMTLRSLERGSDGVTMGAYLAVMTVLGIERDLDELAATAFLSVDDEPRQVIESVGSQPPGDGRPSTPRPYPTVAAPVLAVDDSPPEEVADEDRAPADRASVPVALGGASSEPGFEWLDAPARDLRRLVQLDVGDTATDDRGAGEDLGAIPDLFAALPERDAC